MTAETDEGAAQKAEAIMETVKQVMAEAEDYMCEGYEASPDQVLGWLERAIKAERLASASAYDEMKAENERLKAEAERGQAAWQETAAQHARNEEFYHGLLMQVGKLLGPEVYISDDSSIQDEPLALKIPELVAKLAADLAAAREEANTAARAAQHVAENLTRVMKERDCERIRVQGCYEAIALALDKMDAKDPAAYILSDAQLIPETFVAQLIEEREENVRLRSRLQRTPAAVAQAVKDACEEYLRSQGQPLYAAGIRGSIDTWVIVAAVENNMPVEEVKSILAGLDDVKAGRGRSLSEIREELKRKTEAKE